ncbi:MAG: cysteine desulfurase family protein [Clostridia bacterium]|nr:cysteine desulfurase family protein [Clostridia bacterium]
MKQVYLDNSSTTKPFRQVADIMFEYLTEKYGNPSSLHRKGIQAEKALRWSRNIIAQALGVQAKEVIFTSGGTESNNTAIFGAVNKNRKIGNRVITTKIEHPSVLNIFRNLEYRGYEVIYLDVDSRGIIDLRQLQGSLTDNTILISIMYANNEIGSIQPIAEIGDIVKNHNDETLFHVDAVQAFGKLDINPVKEHIDLLSISGHKIHGPKGIGCLYIKDGNAINSVFYGGGQEYGIRSGTENIPGIVGLGKAVEIIFSDFEAQTNKMRILKKELINGINKLIPSAVLNGPEPDEAVPHIANMSFPGIQGEIMLHALEQYGIFVSTGSACSSNKSSISHVLFATGKDKETIEGAVRFSLGHFNDKEQIDYAIHRVAQVYKQLVRYSRR